MTRWLDQVLQDLRFGLRSLLSVPGFTLLSVTSLALGIMATTAMYSVVRAVVIDPFPYKDVGHLMSIRVSDPAGNGERTYYSTDQYLEFADRATIFEGVIASTISDVVWTGGGDPQRLRGNHCTTNTFDVMGVPPLLGRAVRPADGAAGAQPVAVLGHRFWQRQFGGDAGVVGRQMVLNGVSRTVVGVMPKRFMWRGADVYVPVVFERGRVVEGVRDVHVLGRLKAGVTDAQAEADLRPIVADLARTSPQEFPDGRWRVDLLSFAETFRSDLGETLWILFAAVGLLLLIACVNVSNLLLSRSATRQREMAVRAAIGAGRARLARQLLTESLLIAAGGALLGVPLAYLGLTAIIALVPPGTIPDESEIVINGAVLGFTVLVSCATALIFGLAPAWQTSDIDLTESLKDGARSITGGRRQALISNGLVVAEVALSVMLLVGAALMMRTLLAMQDVDLGIRTERLLTMRVPLVETRYPDVERRVAFFQTLLTRLEGTPGIRAAGLNTGVHPFGGWTMPIVVPGRAADDRPVLVHQASDGYLRAMGIPLLRGRALERGDLERRQRVAVVNESLVEQYFGEVEPLGQVVRAPRLKEPPVNLPEDAFEIVGVVRDTVNRDLTQPLRPEIFVPYTLAGFAQRLVVRTDGDAESAVAVVRAEVAAIDRGQPLSDIRSLESALDDFVFAGPRFSLTLFAVFAALGLTLAVVGVYGVIAHGVSRRTQEIGVRMALGATAERIVSMVIGSGVKLILAGIAIGLVAASAAARLMQELIWNVSPWDPVSFAAVAALLLVVGLQATLWPALRATRVNPVAALRRQ
jgi:putative ABC transport system permease protein